MQPNCQEVDPALLAALEALEGEARRALASANVAMAAAQAAAARAAELRRRYGLPPGPALPAIYGSADLNASNK